MSGSVEGLRQASWEQPLDPDAVPYLFGAQDIDPLSNDQTGPTTFAQVLTAQQGAASATPASTTSSPPRTLTGFAAGSRPQAQDVTFAKLAADVYQDSGQGADGWHRMSDDEISALGLKPAVFQDDSAHFKAAIYTDGHGHYAVAFRGTNPQSVQDWKTDYSQALGQHTRAYGDAERLGSAVTTQLGANNVVMVGHSLGGGEADAAALAGGCSAVTFNAAGLSDAAISEANWTPSEARQAMETASRSYTVDGEALTSTQDNSGGVLPTAMGHRIHLKDPEPASHPDATPMFMPDGESYAPYFVAVHSVWLHGVGTVLESMGQDPRLLH